MTEECKNLLIEKLTGISGSLDRREFLSARRERIATACLPYYLSLGVDEASEWAARAADALIAELDKPQESKP